MALQAIDRITELDISLEQYPTPATIVASILFDAQMTYGDITDRVVLDLGCGDGIFAIGAAMLGAERVIGIDIQTKALKVSQSNSSLLGTELITDFVLSDVEHLDLTKQVHTVVSNPPFGIKTRGADMKFLRKALSLADVTYSLHLSSEKNRSFLMSNIERLGGTVTQIEKMEFPIRKIYEFHKKALHMIEVDLYRISMKECE